MGVKKKVNMFCNQETKWRLMTYFRFLKYHLAPLIYLTLTLTLTYTSPYPYPNPNLHLTLHFRHILQE